MAYKSGEGNVFVTMFGNVSLCKTNSEIKSPDFLFISMNKLISVFGDKQETGGKYFLNSP